MQGKIIVFEWSDEKFSSFQSVMILITDIIFRPLDSNNEYHRCTTPDRCPNEHLPTLGKIKQQKKFIAILKLTFQRLHSELKIKK